MGSIGTEDGTVRRNRRPCHGRSTRSLAVPRVAFGTLGLLAALLGAPKEALAQSTADKAAAQVLFEEARGLTKAGKWAEACPKFAQSQKLDPAGGTLLNLANCYEQIGKTASAWVMFMEAEADGRRVGNQRRIEEAGKRAAALKPTLSTLKIEVPEPVDGLIIKRSGELVRDGQWGAAVPVDPGTYEIVAAAPSKKPWSGTVSVNAGAHAATLAIPLLEVETAASGTPGPKTAGAGQDPVIPPDGETGDDGLQWALGWVVGGVGLAGVAVGTVLRIVALDKDEQSLEYCLPDDPTQCYAEGVDLRDQAISLQTGSVVAWAVGGAALVAGVVLLFTAPSEDSPAPIDDSAAPSEEAHLELLPLVGPGSGGLLLQGRF